MAKTDTATASPIDAFEFVDEEWPSGTIPKEPRERLIRTLQEQIKLVQAEREGRTYQKTKSTRTGETTHRNLRPMYRKAADGTYRIQVRYTQTPVELRPGKTVFRVSDLRAVEDAFQRIIEHVRSGALDEQLTRLSAERRAKFTKEEGEAEAAE